MGIMDNKTHEMDSYIIEMDNEMHKMDNVNLKINVLFGKIRERWIYEVLFRNKQNN